MIQKLLDSCLRVGFRMQIDCRLVSRCKTPTGSEGHGEPTRGTTLELVIIGHQKKLQKSKHAFLILSLGLGGKRINFFHIFSFERSTARLAQHLTFDGPMVRGCLASLVHLIAVPNQVKDSGRLLVLVFLFVSG